MDIPTAVANLWYVSAPSPAQVLEREPKADRGYGRKFLAQLNPAFPVTPIGQFPLNRSAQADTGEFYIGGYPGVAVVQTVLKEESLTLSLLSAKLRNATPARDVYVVATNEEEGYGGFAHWHEGQLKRSFCATRYTIIEDFGLPEAFESPFWAGEHNDGYGGIALPFNPVDLALAAQDGWLGITVGQDGPDLDVVGYAVDGRPEPKVDLPPQSTRSMDELTQSSASKLGLGSANADYDDYEDYTEDPEPATGDELARFASASTDLARKIGRESGSWLRRAGSRIGATSRSVADKAATKAQSLKDRWRS